MKFLAMHITNQKSKSFDTFTVGNLQNIFMEHDFYFTLYPNDFWHKWKIINFDPYNDIFAYCNKYIRATYDWFCGPGSHVCMHVFQFQYIFF